MKVQGRDERTHEGPGRDPSLEDHGWIFHRQKGSQRQYKHPAKPGEVTVAGKPSDEMAPGTLGSILCQAGIDEDEEKEGDE